MLAHLSNWHLQLFMPFFKTSFATVQPQGKNGGQAWELLLWGGSKVPETDEYAKTDEDSYSQEYEFFLN